MRHSLDGCCGYICFQAIQRFLTEALRGNDKARPHPQQLRDPCEATQLNHMTLACLHVCVCQYWQIARSVKPSAGSSAKKKGKDKKDKKDKKDQKDKPKGSGKSKRKDESKTGSKAKKAKAD